MNEFRYRHFKAEIILQCVRWYCKYGISYRNLEEMMLERGVDVDHTTIYRWVQIYGPEINKRMRHYLKGHYTNSWRVDETYIKIKGKWKYLYRAVDSKGKTIDFYLSHRRNSNAAKRFLVKCINGLDKYNMPAKINTDKNPAYGEAINDLKKSGKLDDIVIHRQNKYLNNIVEADHGKLKRLIKPTLGFKSFKTGYNTIKGFEIMNMFRKNQFQYWYNESKTKIEKLMGEIRLIEKQFDVYSFLKF